MPVKREIIYPVFLECCSYADDIFWQNIFEELAYGKAPFGTYISKGFLTCSYKNKEFSYKIERKDPKILYSDIYSLLSDKLGILSYKEKTRKRLDFHEIEKTIKHSKDEWTSIRRKNIKDIMYEKYVIDMKNTYNLSYNQSKYLLAVLLLSIMFKTISSKDIVYKDNKIIEIEGINFQKGKIILNRSLCGVNNQILESFEGDSNDDNIMYYNWSLYLDKLRQY